MLTIYTIGHSTHEQNEFVELLKTYGVTQLVDIRTIPKSRHNPQFMQDTMKKYLPEADILYHYVKDLGGLRPKVKDSINTAWRNLSFRNYADYMQTDEFQNALDELIELAKNKPTAIMCAEAVPWRCHRSLVGDALVVRDVTVTDIMSRTSMTPHTLTSFAHVEGTKLTYPPEKDSQTT